MIILFILLGFHLCIIYQESICTILPCTHSYVFYFIVFQVTFWSVLLFYYFVPGNRIQPQIKYSIPQLWFRRKQVLVNVFFFTPLIGWLLIWLMTSVPLSSSSMHPHAQPWVCIILTDFIFALCHWIFHQPMFYFWHKIHHSAYSPSAFDTLFCHPLELLICNIFPILLPPFLVGMSPLLMAYWIMMTLASALNNHSGQVYPWWMGIPSPLYHDIHHRDGGKTGHFSFSGVPEVLIFYLWKQWNT